MSRHGNQARCVAGWTCVFIAMDSIDTSSALHSPSLFKPDQFQGSRPNPRRLQHRVRALSVARAPPPVPITSLNLVNAAAIASTRG